MDDDLNNSTPGNSIQISINSRNSDGEEPFSDKALKNVAGVSPSNRYLRFDEVLSHEYSHRMQLSYKAFDTKNGIEVAWHIINLDTLQETEQRQVTDVVGEFKEKKFESRYVTEVFDSWFESQSRSLNIITSAHSTLREFMNEKVVTLRWKIVKKWCKQILQGLIDLHNHSSPIVHGKIGCSHIYIDSGLGTTQIGNVWFGAMLDNNNNKTENNVGATTRFSLHEANAVSAPEVLARKQLTVKVDIYSFGLFVLELITREEPFNEYKDIIPQAKLFRRIIQGYQPMSIKRIQNITAVHFIESCLLPEDSRPSATELLAHEFLTKSDVDDENEVKLIPLSELSPISFEDFDDPDDTSYTSASNNSNTYTNQRSYTVTKHDFAQNEADNFNNIDEHNRRANNETNMSEQIHESKYLGQSESLLHNKGIQDGRREEKAESPRDNVARASTAQLVVTQPVVQSIDKEQPGSPSKSYASQNIGSSNSSTSNESAGNISSRALDEDIKTNSEDLTVSPSLPISPSSINRTVAAATATTGMSSSELLCSVTGVIGHEVQLVMWIPSTKIKNNPAISRQVEFSFDSTRDNFDSLATEMINDLEFTMSSSELSSIIREKVEASLAAVAPTVQAVQEQVQQEPSDIILIPIVDISANISSIMLDQKIDNTSLEETVVEELNLIFSKVSVEEFSNFDSSSVPLCPAVAIVDGINNSKGPECMYPLVDTSIDINELTKDIKDSGSANNNTITITVASGTSSNNSSSCDVYSELGLDKSSESQVDVPFELLSVALNDEPSSINIEDSSLLLGNREESSGCTDINVDSRESNVLEVGASVLSTESNFISPQISIADVGIDETSAGEISPSSEPSTQSLMNKNTVATITPAAGGILRHELILTTDNVLCTVSTTEEGLGPELQLPILDIPNDDNKTDTCIEPTAELTFGNIDNRQLTEESIELNIHPQLVESSEIELSMPNTSLSSASADAISAMDLGMMHIPLVQTLSNSNDESDNTYTNSTCGASGLASSSGDNKDTSSPESNQQTTTSSSSSSSTNNHSNVLPEDISTLEKEIEKLDKESRIAKRTFEQRIQKHISILEEVEDNIKQLERDHDSKKMENIKKEETSMRKHEEELQKLQAAHELKLQEFMKQKRKIRLDNNVSQEKVDSSSRESIIDSPAVVLGVGPTSSSSGAAVSNANPNSNTSSSIVSTDGISSSSSSASGSSSSSSVSSHGLSDNS